MLLLPAARRVLIRGLRGIEDSSRSWSVWMMLDAFSESCALYLRIVAAIPDLRTGARYTHPWFGSLDAAGWQCMGGMHMALHRQQIERIIAGL